MGCLYCGLKESGIRLPPIQNTDREGVASRFLHTFKLVSNLNFSREDDLEGKNKNQAKQILLRLASQYLLVVS